MDYRDRHVVVGNDPVYRGETIYAWHGGRKRIEYRYWNSLGGQSDGYVEAGADGTLRFLDDHYVGPDGAEDTFSSEMTRSRATSTARPGARCGRGYSSRRRRLQQRRSKPAQLSRSYLPPRSRARW